MIYWKGYYYMGLCGYELWVDDDDLRDDTMHVLFVGTDRKQKARRYKIQVRNKDGFATTGHRQFVRPYGRRIYLDECITNHRPNNWKTNSMTYLEKFVELHPELAGREQDIIEYMCPTVRFNVSVKRSEEIDGACAGNDCAKCWENEYLGEAENTDEYINLP